MSKNEQREAISEPLTYTTVKKQQISSPGNLVETMKRYIAEKKNIYGVFASKKVLRGVKQQLLHEFPSLKIQCYQGGSSIDAKDENVNVVWKNYQVILTTTCITVGVNFDEKDYFSAAFMYFSTSGGLVRDLFQSVMRVRHLSENKVYYSVDPKCFLQSPFGSTKVERLKNRIRDIYCKSDEVINAEKWYLNACYYNAEEERYNRKKIDLFVDAYFKFNNYKKSVGNQTAAEAYVAQAEIALYDDIPDIENEKQLREIRMDLTYGGRNDILEKYTWKRKLSKYIDDDAKIAEIYDKIHENKPESNKFKDVVLHRLYELANVKGKPMTSYDNDDYISNNVEKRYQLWNFYKTDILGKVFLLDDLKWNWEETALYLRTYFNTNTCKSRKTVNGPFKSEVVNDLCQSWGMYTVEKDKITAGPNRNKYKYQITEVLPF